MIQRNRKNSHLDFNKNWREYIGDPDGDFWAGLKLMYILMHNGQWEMRVDFQRMIRPGLTSITIISAWEEMVKSIH